MLFRSSAFLVYFLDETGSYSIWTGDPSSQIIYKKNNRLFFLGSVTVTGTISQQYDPNIKGKYVSGPLYCAENFPLYNFLTNSFIDKNHYWYPFNQGLTLATQIDFTRIETSINNLSSRLNSLYQQWNST